MTKYEVHFSSIFKKSLKKISKQGKNLEKLFTIIERLANKEELEEKYKNYILKDDKYYVNCFECHLSPDWLLVYRYDEDKLILVLVNTGSHSEVLDM